MLSLHLILTISIEEDHAEDHTERVDVKLLRWAVPGVASTVMSHPHACDHHTCHPQHLRARHEPRQRPQAAHAHRHTLHHLPHTKEDTGKPFRGVQDDNISWIIWIVDLISLR